MGWLTYSATCYDRKGKIDRKAEMDNLFNQDTESCYWKVLKSQMVGRVYYAAIEKIKKDDGEDRTVIGLVCLTSVDGDVFGFKDMDETMGPGYCDCPMSIINLLTPTDNEYANNWRNACMENARLKKEKKKNPDSLSNLPLGSIIELSRGDKLIKVQTPQFKRPFWRYTDKNYYVPLNHINGYKVIRRGE